LSRPRCTPSAARFPSGCRCRSRPAPADLGQSLTGTAGGRRLDLRPVQLALVVRHLLQIAAIGLDFFQRCAALS
jgi:hypothetical protein